MSREKAWLTAALMLLLLLLPCARAEDPFVEYSAGEQPFASAIDAQADDVDEYTLYWYALNPGHSRDEGWTNDQWLGMGTSTIRAVDPNTFSEETELPESEISFSVPGSFPDIFADGKLYAYAAPGTPQSQMYGYYTVNWYNIKVAFGANSGANGYNPTVTTTMTYHRDGLLHFNSIDWVNLRFAIQPPGEADYQVMEDYSQRVERGESESEIRIPGELPGRQLRGINYTFDGWYRDDPSCAPESKVVTWDRAIDADVTYYGRYLPAKGSVTVTKRWDDSGNRDGLRPKMLEVQLVRHGEIVASDVMRGDGDVWTLTFENLPIYDADGKPIPYEARESVPEGYAPVESDDSLVLINRREVTSCTLRKCVTGLSGRDAARVGDALQYAIEVENTGNVPITDALGDAFTVNGKSVALQLYLNGTAYDGGPLTLAPGERRTFIAKYHVKASDAVLNNSANFGDARAQVTTPVEPKPAIELTKEVLARRSSYGLSDEISYRVTVTNVGNRNLAELQMRDAMFPNGGECQLMLPIGESASFDYTHQVTEADLAVAGADGMISNTVIAMYKGETLGSASASVPARQSSPALTAVKRLMNAGTGEGGAFRAGETAHFQILINNTGNITLHNLVVHEVLPDAHFIPQGEGTIIVDALSPNSSIALEAEYTLREDDIVRGTELTNIVQVFCDELSEGTKASVTFCAEPPKPAWTVTKRATILRDGAPLTGSEAQAGDKVHYEIAIENVGNVTLEGLQLSDSFQVNGEAQTLSLFAQDGSVYSGETFTLEPGATVRFMAEYTAQIPDIELRNTASVGEVRSEMVTPVVPGEIPVILRAGSATKVYDGLPLTSDACEATNLPSGYSVHSVTMGDSADTPEKESAIARTGTVRNHIVNFAIVEDATGRDVTDRFVVLTEDGELTVEPRKLTILADSAEKEYDATALTAGWKLDTATPLAEGDCIVSVQINGTQTEVGSSANIASAAIVKNASGEDVTSCYAIHYVDGKLTVNPRSDVQPVPSPTDPPASPQPTPSPAPTPQPTPSPTCEFPSIAPYTQEPNAESFDDPYAGNDNCRPQSSAKPWRGGTTGIGECFD